VKNPNVYSTERPLKLLRKEPLVIRFSDDDYEGISWPHSDALVVALAIANHNVHRILVDIGSSTNILYWSVFEKLKLSRDRIVPIKFPLMGFAGEYVHPVRLIELPLTAGSVPKPATVMVKFLLVNRPSAYNAIIRRTILNQLGAMTSTPHLKMNFPPRIESVKLEVTSGKLNIAIV
jgi:hypothetical protein